MTENNEETQYALEATFIGTLLDFPQELEQLTVPIETKHFTFAPTKLIFEAMLRLLDAGKPIDIALVANDLNAHGLLEEVGGESGITQFQDYAAEGKLVKAYAIDLVKNSEKQYLKKHLAHAFNEINNGEEIAHVTSNLSAVMRTLYASSFAKSPIPISHVLADCFDSASDEQYVKTGFQKLDITHGGGLARGSMTVIGAAPSMGKSQFVVNLMNQMAGGDPPVRVLCISMEMSEREMLHRLIAIAANVPQATIKSFLQHSDNASWPPATREKIEDAIRYVSSLPIKFMSGSFTADDFRNIAATTSGLCDVIIVDYLQRSAGLKNQKPLERVEAASRACKDIALQHDIAVVAIASLNREGYREKDTKPDLSHIRECGNIEYDADNVWTLWREKAEGVENETLELHIRKQRNGPLDWLLFEFELATGKIVEG